eukprot:2586400-Rhodomonas_salina.6
MSRCCIITGMMIAYYYPGRTSNTEYYRDIQVFRVLFISSSAAFPGPVRLPITSASSSTTTSAKEPWQPLDRAVTIAVGTPTRTRRRRSEILSPGAQPERPGRSFSRD